LLLAAATLLCCSDSIVFDETCYFLLHASSVLMLLRCTSEDASVEGRRSFGEKKSMKKRSTKEEVG
jgi:hypothetical protein